MAQADNLKPVFIDQDILMDTSDCHFSDNKYIAPSKGAFINHMTRLRGGGGQLKCHKCVMRGRGGQSECHMTIHVV